jgi:hypothetical protein
MSKKECLRNKLISILWNLCLSSGTRLIHVTGYSSLSDSVSLGSNGHLYGMCSPSVYCHFCNCAPASANRIGHVASQKDEVVRCTRRRWRRRAGCTPPSPPHDSSLRSPALACSCQNLQRVPAHRSPIGRSPAATLAGHNPPTATPGERADEGWREEQPDWEKRRERKNWMQPWPNGANLVMWGAGAWRRGPLSPSGLWFRSYRSHERAHE